jgi:hypothetical protein
MKAASGLPSRRPLLATAASCAIFPLEEDQHPPRMSAHLHLLLSAPRRVKQIDVVLRSFLRCHRLWLNMP